jgi:hypothetical protein
MMERKRVRHVLGVLCVVAALLLVACGAGDTSTAQEPAVPVEDNGGAVDEPQAEQVVGEGEVSVIQEEEEDNGFPASLVLHPEATNLQLNPAGGVFVYTVPGLVAETMEYLEAEMKAKGWEELGQPVIMGHLATLNMTKDKSRVTISMQDNERSQTTRIQMLLLEQ